MHTARTHCSHCTHALCRLHARIENTARSTVHTAQTHAMCTLHAYIEYTARTHTPRWCAPVLAHIPSFGRNPRGSPDFLAYPVPKACQRRVLGTWVPRSLGVARSALTPRAAQALSPGSGSRLAGSPAWHRLPQCPGYGHRVSCCYVVCVLGLGARPPLTFAGFAFWFGACSGLGVRLPSSVPGRGSGFVRVNAGCACISPFFGSGFRRVCSGAGCGFLGGYEGRGVASVPLFLTGACSWCPGTGWDVTSPLLAGFVGGVCG